MQNITVNIKQYKQHLYRLYKESDEFFRALKSIYGKDWPSILLHKSQSTKIYRFHDYEYHFTHFKNDRHSSFGKSYDFPHERHHIPNYLIALYFPPKFYPMVDNVYPTVKFSINDLLINEFVLDGSNRLYTPIADLFWYPFDCAKHNSVHIYTSDKPYYIFEIKDNMRLINYDDLYIPDITIKHYLTKEDINADLVFKEENKDIRLYSEHYSHLFDRNPEKCLDYPYILAANKIKQAWLSYKLKKKRKIINNEIRLIPGIGIDFDNVNEKHTSNGKFMI